MVNKRLTIIGCLLTKAAFGQASDQDWDGGFDEPPAQLRDSWTLSLDYGLGFGNVDGYPRNASQIGDPDYRADTGLAAGHLGRAWTGLALKDWLTFGLGTELLMVSGNSLRAKGGAFLIRIEAFPLWQKGGKWRDLGLAANFGIGGMYTRRDQKVVADGGSLAFVGISAFHETLRLGNLALGPTLGYSHYFSEMMTVHLGQVGIRGAFYPLF